MAHRRTKKIYQYFCIRYKAREEYTMFSKQLQIIKQSAEKCCNNSNNEKIYANVAAKNIESIKYLNNFFSFAKQEKLKERIVKLYREVHKIKDKTYLHSVNKLSIFKYLYNNRPNI